MVYIKKLEIKGFKSFKDPITLNFTPNLNVITGPNGSGKSNIFDAIIFCLGENRAKSLRVNRLSALIHDTVTKESSARVSIHMDNKDRKIPVDSDNVVISRELRQDGESFYYLNGKKVSKNTLSDILEIALISPSNLNIIPQGLVTRLSDLNPDEKRRLIEEIVGIEQFDEKKEQALEQLKEADMRLQVALAKIEEVRKRVHELEAQRNTQIRLRHLERAINYLKAIKISRKIKDLKRKIEEIKLEREKKLKKLEENKEKLKEIQEDLEKLEEKRREFLALFRGDKSFEQVSLQGEIAKLNNEIKILEEKKEKLEAQIRELGENLPKDYEVKRKKEEELEALKKDLTEKEEEAKRLENLLNTMKVELKKLLKEKESLEKEINKANLMETKVREKINFFQNKLLNLERNLDKKRNLKENIRNRLNQLKEKEKTFKDFLVNLEEKIKNIKEKLKEEEEKLKDIDQNRLEVKERQSKLEEEIERALDTLNKVEKKIMEFEVKEEILKLVKPKELTLKKLEEVLKEAKVKGYLGILRDLIKYDESYSKAIEAVGERWLNSIVVSNLESMGKVAEVVKKIRIGPVLIIPLSEIPDVPQIQYFNFTPLIKVIECDENLKKLIKFIFGDVVLVNSLREGFLAASKNLKFVTIKGDFFEPDTRSFLTGYIKISKEIFLEDLPSDEVKKGLEALRRVIKERKKILVEMNKREEDLIENKVKKSVYVERLKGEVKAFSKFLIRYKRISRSINRDIFRLTKRDEILERSLNNMQNKLEKIKNIIKSLEKKIEDLKKMEKSEMLNQLNLKKAEMEKNIEELTLKFKEVNMNLETIRAKIMLNLNPNLERFKEEIKNKEKLLKEKEKEMEDNDKRLEELRKKLSLLEEEEKKFLEEAKGFMEKLEFYDKEIKEKHNFLENVKVSITSIEKDILSLEKSLEALEDEINKSYEELNLLGFKEVEEDFQDVDSILRDISFEYEDIKTKVNFLADSNYKSIFESYKNLSLRRNQLEKDRDAIVKFIEDLDNQKRKIFLEAFEKIDKELRNIFKSLTNGSAWLEIEDLDNIFEKGVFLMVQFPNKPARESSTVSGGEKTIATLSFLLAVQTVFPSPFYLFDEIDAHLDPINLDKLANLLKEKSNNFQIILISLRENMIAKADQIFGIYMDNGISKVVRYKTPMEIKVKS